MQEQFASQELRNNSHRNNPGFALLDALMAIFLFGLGFAVLFGLTESALAEATQAENLTQAANIAQEKIEALHGRSWLDNFVQGACLPGQVVEGDEGRFRWRVFSEWEELPDTLHVKVEVLWPEGRTKRTYQLESVYHVE